MKNGLEDRMWRKDDPRKENKLDYNGMTATNAKKTFTLLNAEA